MKVGDLVQIEVRVLRVDGERVDAQTANGQLIQTSLENCKMQKLPEHKAILKPKENKGINQRK